jgi:molybdopterin-guanine dinucleotide biosynthesis protein A
VIEDDDLVRRLIEAMHDGHAELAVAHDGERLQPVFALIGVSLLESLQQFLERGDRKIDLWYAGHEMALADFSDTPNMFLNLNTPADEETLAQQLGAR